VLVVAAAAALGWHAVYLAALSGQGDPVIPVFDWLFAFVPALVAGLVTRRHGRVPWWHAVLGTAAVTLPMTGLSWSLDDGTAGVVEPLGAGLYSAAVFGLVPLLVAMALTRAGGARPAGVAPR
jgi:hypothetical protein